MPDSVDLLNGWLGTSSEAMKPFEDNLARFRRYSRLKSDHVIKVMREFWPEGDIARHEDAIRGIVWYGLPRLDREDFSTYVGRRKATRHVWGAFDVRCGRTIPEYPAVTLAAKVMLTIEDALAGRTTRLNPRHHAIVQRVLGRSLVADPVGDQEAGPADVRRHDGHALVDFVFPWRPSPVRTEEQLGLSEAQIAIQTIAGPDAPVACTLWTPEGRIGVRRHGTEWLRPVLAPDSWQPATLEAFARAARDGTPWRDNPFLPLTGRNTPTFDIIDVAGPRPLRKGDDARLAEGREEAFRRAGTLYLVDGIVHRTTPEPTAGIGVVRMSDGLTAGPAWTLGELNSMSVMDTLDCYEGDTCFLASRQWIENRHGSTHDLLHGIHVADWTGIVSDGAALECLEPCLRKQGRKALPWPAPVDLAEIVDARMMPSDTSRCARVASRLVHAGTPRLWGERVRSAETAWHDDLADCLEEAMDAGNEAGQLREEDLTKVHSVASTTLGLAREAPPDLGSGMWMFAAMCARHAAQPEAEPELDDLGTMPVFG